MFEFISQNPHWTILIVSIVTAVGITWWMSLRGYDKKLEKFREDFKKNRQTKKRSMFEKFAPTGVIIVVTCLALGRMQPNENNIFNWVSITISLIMLASLILSIREFLADRRHTN